MTESSYDFDIMTVGSITTDIFVRPCQLPVFEKDGKEFFSVEVGEKIQLDDVFRSGGGSAGNTAVGFSKLGLNVYPVGVIGDDEEGNHICEKFEDLHVATDGLIIQEDSPSSISFILNACNGKRTVLHHRTVSEEFNGKILHDAPSAKGIYVGHLYPAAESILTAIEGWKAKHNSFFAWNPGKTQFSKQISSYTQVMKYTDLLILNVEEAEQFTNLKAPHVDVKDVHEDIIGTSVKYGAFLPVAYMHDVRDIAQVFLSLGVKQVVITDGKRGTQVFTKDYHYQLYAKNDICISTLGAGDAFSVGVVSAYLNYKKLSEQLQWGSVCATNVVKQFGAQHGYITQRELEKELEGGN